MSARQVRDLYNEEAEPGVSQGKLFLVLDMLDEVRRVVTDAVITNVVHADVRYGVVDE